MHAKVLKTYKGKAEIEIVCVEASNDNVHCGACNMGQKPSTKPETVLAQNKIAAKPGDMVECNLKEHAEIKAALLLFVGPLVLFMVALGLSSVLKMELWQSFLSGTAVLVVTYIALRFLLKNKTYYYITGIK